LNLLGADSVAPYFTVRFPFHSGTLHLSLYSALLTLSAVRTLFAVVFARLFLMTDGRSLAGCGSQGYGYSTRILFALYSMGTIACLASDRPGLSNSYNML
jgi:hypothetical protein